jgi:hypothetical protein
VKQVLLELQCVATNKSRKVEEEQVCDAAMCCGENAAAVLPVKLL